MGTQKRKLLEQIEENNLNPNALLKAQQEDFKEIETIDVVDFSNNDLFDERLDNLKTELFQFIADIKLVLSTSKTQEEEDRRILNHINDLAERIAKGD